MAGRCSKDANLADSLVNCCHLVARHARLQGKDRVAHRNPDAGSCVLQGGGAALAHTTIATDRYTYAANHRNSRMQDAVRKPVPAVVGIVKL